MKKVLVTGGSGFIGANLVRRLLAAGHEVHLLMRPEFSRWRLREIEAQVTIHLVELTRSADVDAALQRIKPAWVFHLAAHGAYSFQTDVAEIVRTNTVGTATLAEACVKTGVEIMIHTGSSSEYGRKDHPPSENETTEPNSAYAATKAAATEYCRYLARTHKIPLPTLRLYSVYGPYEDPRRLLPALVVHALAGRWPPLTTPDTSRDFVHVDDVNDALIALAQKPPRDPAAIYNVGSGRQTSLGELIEIAGKIFEISGMPAWNSMPPRVWDTNVWIANPAKIKAELGWSLKTDLARGLRSFAAWLQADPVRLEFYRQPGLARKNS
jgi:UDP-glucose 4-epimerase